VLAAVVVEVEAEVTELVLLCDVEPLVEVALVAVVLAVPNVDVDEELADVEPESDVDVVFAVADVDEVSVVLVTLVAEVLLVSATVCTLVSAAAPST
jgi:hypothetical protein